MAGPVTAPRPPREAVEAALLRLATERGADKSLCPSEVARALAPDDWRPLMTPVRAEAVRLAREGRVEVLRKGKPVAAPDLDSLRGVIRVRIAARCPP